MIDGVPNPIVTVCVATFQSEPYIERTLKAICEQSYPHFRCIVSDDGSTDRTLEICTRIAGNDSRVSVQANQDRLGWIGNMNRILAQDLGNYFVNISHDDEIKPQFLESLLRHLSEYPEASVAFSDAEEFLGKNRERNLLFYDESIGNVPVSKRARPIAISRPLSHWFLAYHGLVRNSTLCVQRRLRRNLAGEFTADKLWVLGLALSGPFVRVPEVLWRKESTEDSVSAKWTYSLASLAAVQLSATKLVLGSGVNVLDRAKVCCFLFWGWARVAKWKLQSLFQANELDQAC